MRSEGWNGGRMGEKRRKMEKEARMKGEHTSIRDDITRILDLSPEWWDGDPAVQEQPAGSPDDDLDIALDDPLLVSLTSTAF